MQCNASLCRLMTESRQKLFLARFECAVQPTNLSEPAIGPYFLSCVEVFSAFEYAQESVASLHRNSSGSAVYWSIADNRNWAKVTQWFFDACRAILFELKLYTTFIDHSTYFDVFFKIFFWYSLLSRAFFVYDFGIHMRRLDSDQRPPSFTSPKATLRASMVVLKSFERSRCRLWMLEYSIFLQFTIHIMNYT